ncbi:hypothetical protein J5N97_026076 [Dioscorea zingiberensis]|uniref:Uncharacterized protein n=1 Tax=Dioscorea zingiberensis TaxID=325984 RepID=A0A9D5H6B2_9LILI|nr:hypothetical protein J5N97_026076 [Dioscorea zingiberensis]
MLQATRLAGAPLKRILVGLNQPPFLQRTAMAFTVLSPCRELPLRRVPPFSTLFRSITHMRRRSPPAPPKKDEEQESSESEDDEDLELGLGMDDVAVEGSESEEWEGFVLDFGADGKESKNKGADEESSLFDVF